MTLMPLTPLTAPSLKTAPANRMTSTPAPTRTRLVVTIGTVIQTIIRTVI